MAEPVIGFCTTCHGRLWQLKQTLPTTLQSIRGTQHFVALFDFHSPDGLEDHIRKVHARDIAAGHLWYFRAIQDLPWHVCQAKNTAHRLARHAGATFLMNLDADNILSPTDLAWMETQLASDPRLLMHQWTQEFADGSFGRIGMPADDWWSLGGYDEALGPMGWQDFDLLLRGRLAELTYLREAGTEPAIANSIGQKIEAIEDMERSGNDREDYGHMNRRNMTMSFTRPPRLPTDEQRRFRGTLNFSETLEI